jgi:hypothetical protein
MKNLCRAIAFTAAVAAYTMFAADQRLIVNNYTAKPICFATIYVNKATGAVTSEDPQTPSMNTSPSSGWLGEAQIIISTGELDTNGLAFDYPTEKGDRSPYLFVTQNPALCRVGIGVVQNFEQRYPSIKTIVQETLNRGLYQSALLAIHKQQTLQPRTGVSKFNPFSKKEVHEVFVVYNTEGLLVITSNKKDAERWAKARYAHLKTAKDAYYYKLFDSEQEMKAFLAPTR